MSQMANLPAASSAHLLQDVGRVLESEGIRWATIGALAVAYHGWIRASMDADALITFKGSASDLDRISEKLREQGWKVDSRVGDEDDPLGFVIRIADDLENQVDLIGGIRKLDLGFFERRVQADFDGMVLEVASSEDLIALKIFAGGPKDLEDASGVIEVMGANMDRALLLKLCRGFGPVEEKLCAGLLLKFIPR
jgi:predicted nucleotidyltransferase